MSVMIVVSEETRRNRLKEVMVPPPKGDVPHPEYVNHNIGSEELKMDKQKNLS